MERRTETRPAETELVTLTPPDRKPRLGGRRSGNALAALSAIAALCLSGGPAHAQPSNDGGVIAPAIGKQTGPRVFRQVGAWSQVYWSDDRAGVNGVRGAMVDTSGVVAFTGALVDNFGFVPSGAHTLVAAAATPGSNWTVWQDSTTSYDLSVSNQYMTNGWGATWVHRTICNAAGDQVAPTAAGDANSAVFAWQDARAGAANTDIWANFVWGLSSPPPVTWPANGVQLCSATGNQLTPAACPDGSGGAIVAWVDLRSGTADIWAQRVDMTGAILWSGLSARQTCTAAGAQTGVRIASDGAGGAIIAWIDARNGGADVYAQRINSAGAVQWLANGVPVCTVAGDKSGLALEPNGSGGAYLAWVDARHGQDIYFNHLTSTGTVLDPNGSPLCTAPGAQNNLRTASSGTAFYLAWEDRRGGGADIYAYALDFGGSGAWGQQDGSPICVAPGDQTLPAIAPDGYGGATVAWQDARLSPHHPQVYAQRIRPDGALTYADSDRPKFVSARDVPGDQGGFVSLSFTAGRLDNRIDRGIRSIRVWRRVAPSAAVVASASLEGAGEATARARYLARRSGTAAEAATVTYWEAVATLPAQQLEGYAYTAATTQDSTAASNPYTAFFLTAITDDVFTFYESDIDSAYSVDNLAPVMPQAFVGQPIGGSIALHWAKSAEPDFAVYRLHRGGTPDFPMNPGNLVTEQADTGYVDTPSLGADLGTRGGATTPEAGGPWYYKLVALDTHGNVSPAALLSPQQTNSVGGAAGGRLWLANASPNPVRLVTTIAYRLPSEGDVALELFDVRGARVRRLASGRRSAGDHSVRWDGRGEDGARLASGVYFLRLVTGEGSMNRRVVVAD